MNIEKIKQLMELAAQSPFAELEYQEGDSSLRLAKEASVSRPVSSSNGTMQNTPSVSAAPAAEVIDTSVQTMTAAEEMSSPVSSSDEVVSSPLVGVFYTSPAEGEDPFVTVGSRVKKGQILGIIETMKLMNELESEMDGEITEILVENEQVVEYGQPLFRIRPLGK
ncbi:MAG: acetyl-CoA carboxylase biotin carboxyl carrier protein [Clostridiales bacterium]|nr:acetyl-CoA carboxylase biotin carboxyl carrier protein [Clostridiales bacterium]